MSHVAQCNVVLKNLDVIELAVRRLGGTLHRGVNHIRMFNAGFVDDSTTWKQFFEPAEAERIARMSKAERVKIINAAMNSADAVARFPGAEYDVGIIKQSDGSYRLRWDTWANGGGLHRFIGANGGLLAQAYGVEAAKRAARLRGHTVKEVPGSNGSIKLEVLVR